MIDLHSHVLPGVDDGARNLAEAVAMCRHAAEDGCRALVATPHQRRDEWETSDPARLAQLLAELQRAVGESIRLYLGGEVRVDSDLVHDLAQPGRGGILTLAGTAALLVEFEPMGVGPDPLELVGELADAGFRTVVAHPELTPCLAEDLDLVASLAERGALLQLTAMSLTGDLGRATKDRAWRFLTEGLVHLVASDAHHQDWRPTGLARAHRAVADRAGLAVAQRLFVEQPLALLESRDRASAGLAV